MSWTGCFIGLNGGYAWGRDRLNLADGTLSSDYKMDGGVIGGQIGCDYQVGQFVFGIEGMYDWADIKGGAALVTGGNNLARTLVDGLGLVTARAGLAFNQNMTLAYVRGGYAAQHIKNRPFEAPPGTPNQFENSHFEDGWVVGGGLEHRFMPNWSVRAEYLHAEFKGSPNDINVNGGASFPRTTRSRLDLVTVGLNYRF